MTSTPPVQGFSTLVVLGKEIGFSSKSGIPNLAPYSYFNAIADKPPQIMFSSGQHFSLKGYKDSLTNILSTKEFVINFATSSTKNKMNLSSIDAPFHVDEFKFSNVKKRKSKLIKPPSVAESPINLECKLLKTLKLKSKQNKDKNTLIIGEVVGIYINNKFIKNGRINSVSMRLIARMGYSEYTTISSKFNLARPEW